VGTITGNTVSGHSYTPASYVSTGMLLYYANASTSANTFTENQVGLYHIEGSGTHNGNILTASAAGTGAPAFWGIVVDAPPPSRLPAPLEDQAVSSALKAAVLPQTVLVSNNDLTGGPTGYGIEADGGYGSLDIDFTARNNFVRGWGEGIVITQCTTDCAGTTFVNLDVNQNSITGSSIAALSTYSAPPVDGTINWWESPTGPTHATNPGGTGGLVMDGVTFSPWLCSGVDTAPASVGFQPELSNLCGLPAKLAFSTQPGGALINQPLNPQPVVAVQDAGGNPAINYNGPVTLAIGTNPNTGTLSGTLTLNAVNGTATFTGLSIDRAGAGYTLQASATGLTAAASDPFTISNPLPVVTSLNPTWVRHGSPSFLLTLNGSNFVYNAEVRWNGAPLVVVQNTGAMLIAVVPASLVEAVGTASVTAFNPTPGGGSSAPLTFSIVNVSDVSVTKTDGLASVKGGEVVTYTVVVSNAGPDELLGAVVTDTVPALLTGVTWTCSASAGSTCAASGSGNALQDTVTVANGGSVTYTISGTLPFIVSGTLTNTASLTLPALYVDPTTYNLSATDTTTLRATYVYNLPIIFK